MTLLTDCPFLIDFLLNSYEDARTQPDHRTSLFASRYSGPQFLKLLVVLSAADKSVAVKLVNECGIAEIYAAVQMDPNGRDADGGYLYFEVLYGTETLCNILLAENGRHVKRILRDRELLAGIPFNILISRLKVSALRVAFRNHSLKTTKSQL